MRILLNWIITALIILIISYVMPGVHVDGFVTALLVALVFGILNAVLKPLLLILTLPLTILTFGLFTFILNALLVLLTTHIVHGFHVDGFLAALLFSIVLSLVTGIIDRFK